MSTYSNIIIISMSKYVHVCTQESAEGGDVRCAYDVIRQAVPWIVMQASYLPYIANLWQFLTRFSTSIMLLYNNHVCSIKLSINIFINKYFYQ